MNHVVFPPCWRLLVVMRCTTTSLPCAYHLPEEACTHRQGHLLTVSRNPMLQAVTFSIIVYP